MMKFELLPNEILIECFEYLNALDIFYAFDELNNRFNILIRAIPLYLNCDYVNRSIFNKFYKKTLSQFDVKLQIYSLHLSNTNKWNQINLFHSRFSFNEFPRLRSLTLTGVTEQDIEYLKEILPLIPQLSFLHLIQPAHSVTNILIKCSILTVQTFAVTDLCDHLIIIAQISSITNLTIPDCDMYSLQHILSTVPMLKYLNCRNLSQRRKSYWNHPIPQINYDYQCIHLKQLILLEFHCTFEDLKIFIKYTPNLKSLIISADYQRQMIDAYDWEELIISSLSKLISFQFKFKVFRQQNDHEILDKFKLFYTNFWQEKHYWFIEYILRDSSAEIYTIPYILNTFILTNDLIRYSNELVNPLNIFDNITDLCINHQYITKQFSNRFSKVNSLTLSSSVEKSNNIDNDLWQEYIKSLKIIVNLSHINHLDISKTNQMNILFVLLEILKVASNLSSIKISPDCLKLLLNDNVLQTYLNKMIRKLNISGYSRYIFSDLGRIKQFCEIFSNIVELRWEECQSNDLSCLTGQLKNLSIITIK